MSKITEQLYIGDSDHASNLRWLKQHHITHIVNAAIELKNYFPSEFVYLNLYMKDTKDQDLTPSLEKSYKFIVDAISKGGTVLVHCYAGVSRSSSIVIYFLMKVKGWDYPQALSYLRNLHPSAFPNQGFASQLLNINSKNYQMRAPIPKNTRTNDRYTGNEEYRFVPIMTDIPETRGKYMILNSINSSRNNVIFESPFYI